MIFLSLDLAKILYLPHFPRWCVLNSEDGHHVASFQCGKDPLSCISYSLGLFLLICLFSKAFHTCKLNRGE